MKTVLFFALPFLLFFFSCGSNNNQTVSQDNNSVMNPANLDLNFSLMYDETSKDCRTELIKIRIADYKIVVSKEYNGFKTPEDEYFEKQIGEETEKQILNFIREQQFDKNLKEIQSAEGIGIAGKLKIDMLLPDTSRILLEGKTNIWGSDEHVQREWGEQYLTSRTNLENIEYFGKADAFVAFISKLTDKK